MGRGLRPDVVAEKSVDVSDSSANDWAQALSAVRRELAGAEWRQANARVVIADHWVRYAVVPWRRELTDDAERLAHGRLILRQVYGDEMGGWTMQLGQTVTGCAQLICAIPAALLADVGLMLQQSALRLVSLQPHLVASFNRWRSRMPESGGWFVAVDDGSLAAARLEGDNWVEVHGIRVGRDWAADLNRLRTFERLHGWGAAAEVSGARGCPPAPALHRGRDQVWIRVAGIRGRGRHHARAARSHPRERLVSAPAMRVDFAPGAMRKNAVGIVVLGAGVLSFVAVLLSYQQTRAEAQGLELRSDALDRIAGDGNASGESADDHVANARDVVTELATPWSRLLQELDAAGADNKQSVALLAIEPDVEHRKVRILAESRTLPAALAYTERLQKSTRRCAFRCW